MLLAARDRYGEEIEVKAKIKADGNEKELSGVIAALFGKSVFHNSGAIENNGLEAEEIFVDFDEDTNEEIQKELDQRLKEAAEQGLTTEKISQLKSTIDEHFELFKIRLGSGEPAKVKPLKITLDLKKKPVKVKTRRYPAKQRKFLDRYITQLSNMGFIKPCPQASWQAAPHLVPKDSKPGFRTTIDLQPVNGATKADKWPMPMIESELCDFKGSRHFSAMDLAAGYWQCSLDPTSYDACGIIAPQGTFVSTRVLQELKDAASYFQSTI